MRPIRPPGGHPIIGRLLGAALCLLLAALALRWAIRIIESIAVPLLVIAAVAVALTGLIRWLGYRHNSW